MFRTGYTQGVGSSSIQTVLSATHRRFTRLAYQSPSHLVIKGSRGLNRRSGIPMHSRVGHLALKITFALFN